MKNARLKGLFQNTVYDFGSDFNENDIFEEFNFRIVVSGRRVRTSRIIQGMRGLSNHTPNLHGFSLAIRLANSSPFRSQTVHPIVPISQPKVRAKLQQIHAGFKRYRLYVNV